jgi:hypothetical protein
LPTVTVTVTVTVAALLCPSAARDRAVAEKKRQSKARNISSVFIGACCKPPTVKCPNSKENPTAMLGYTSPGLRRRLAKSKHITLAQNDGGFASRKGREGREAEEVSVSALADFATFA